MRKGHLQPKPNPHTNTIPDEVWDSHQNCFCSDEGTFYERWQQHVKLLQSFIQDKDFNFLKDENGSWLRKEVAS